MKISINDEELFVLSELQKKVIQNDIPSGIFEEDMKRRLKYIIDYPCNHFIEKNAQSVREYLKSKGVNFIPTDKMELAAKVFEYAPVKLSEKEKQKHFVKVDGQDLFEIDETKKMLLKSSEVKDSCCVDLSKEKLKWILQHKYERCMFRLRQEWETRLSKKGVKEIPVDDDAFAELVFSQPDYKNRSEREKV